jgi:hypothetical protein
MMRQSPEPSAREASTKSFCFTESVLPRITPNVAYHAQSEDDPLGDFLRSLERLADYDADEALPAHEYRFTNHKERLLQIRDHHEQRFLEVIAAIRNGNDTIWDIAPHMDWSRPWEQVTGFVRRGPAAKGSYHYIGVQVAAGRVFDAVEPGAPASSIGGVYDALIAAQPGAIRGFVSDAAFYDVGTPGDYWRASLAIAAMEGTDGSSAGAGTRIDASAHVRQSILWDDVQVEAGAQLDECIVTDGVQVPAGASHRRAILVRGDDGEPRVFPLNLEP